MYCFAIYFSAPNCDVCSALKPKITALFQQEFPKLDFYNINTAKYPEVVGLLEFFTNLSLLVYIYKQKVLRKNRTFN